jgi:hypothetical protein
MINLVLPFPKVYLNYFLGRMGGSNGWPKKSEKSDGMLIEP